jgi:UDP:flavonoid glycosyltransferase YjiC (YdhE family)
MFGTLLDGLPMVALPRGADQFVNADRCVAAGVAIRLWGDDLHPEAVRDALRRVLDDDRYRKAATRLAGEIHEMPSPSEVVSILGQLAAT